MARVSDAHLEARRRSILDAACQVFSNKGVESATMAEIAQLAGISPGAIYRYFNSKEVLARGCMSENSNTVQSQWKLETPPEGDALATFTGLSRATFAFLNEPEERADTILFLEGLLSAVRDGNREFLASMRQDCEQTQAGIQRRIEVAKEQGAFPPAFDSRRLAEALFSFYWGARIARLLDPTADTDGQLEEMISILELAAGHRAARRD